MWVDLSFLKRSLPFNCPICCSPIFLKIPRCKQCYAEISKRSLSGYTDTSAILVPKAVSHNPSLKRVCFWLFIYVLIIFLFIGKILETRNLVLLLAKGIQEFLRGVLTAVMFLYINTMQGTDHCLRYTSIYSISIFKFTPRTHEIYRTKDIQSAYALYNSNNKHEYGPISNTMFLSKQVNKGPLMNPFEQFYIQSYYHHNKPIPEQNKGERNPMYELISDLQITSPQNATSIPHVSTVNTFQPTGCSSCWYVARLPLHILLHIYFMTSVLNFSILTRFITTFIHVIVNTKCHKVYNFHAHIRLHKS
jgi:hypothetical protein